MCPRDLPSTFRAAAGPFINFRQLSVRPQALLLTYRTKEGHSVNFHQHFVELGDIPSVFLASADLLSASVKFQCVRGTFH